MCFIIKIIYVPARHPHVSAASLCIPDAGMHRLATQTAISRILHQKNRSREETVDADMPISHDGLLII